MDSDRSFKRRKLSTPTKLSTQSSAAAKLAELRQSRSATKTEHDSTAPLENSSSIENVESDDLQQQDITQVDATDGRKPSVTSAVSKHTPGWGSAKKSTVESESKQGTGINGTSGKSGTNTPSRSATKSQRGRTGEQKYAEDVEMKDEAEVIGMPTDGVDQSGQDEEDINTPRRTTGRRRQPSKKLQESTATPEPVTKRRTPKSIKTGPVRPSLKPSEGVQTVTAGQKLRPS